MISDSAVADFDRIKLGLVLLTDHMIKDPFSENDIVVYHLFLQVIFKVKKLHAIAQEMMNKKHVIQMMNLSRKSYFLLEKQK